MQEAIRNKTGKSVSVENLDKRDAARNKPSANPVIVVQNGKNRDLVDKIDRDYEANRKAQAKAEQCRVSENPEDATEFNVRKDG